MIIEQVNASNYNSWIQPTLTFFDMTLEDIITNLERWFNVPIGTDASVDRTIRLSFHVRHEAREETLQVISLITGDVYKRQRWGSAARSTPRRSNITTTWPRSSTT